MAKCLAFRRWPYHRIGSFNHLSQLKMLGFEHNKSNFEVTFYLMGKINCKEAGFAIQTDRQDEK